MTRPVLDLAAGPVPDPSSWLPYLPALVGALLIAALLLAVWFAERRLPADRADLPPEPFGDTTNWRLP